MDRVVELALIFGFLGLAALVGLASGSDDEDVDPPPPGGSGPPTDDLFEGTEGPDDISAGAGNDTAFGFAGDDQIFLGTGSDRADGGPGDDTIFGGDNADTVVGGEGDDQIDLGAGFDTYNGTGFGPLWDAGDDLIRGGDKSDLINDFRGANRIFGDEGADTLSAVDRPDDAGTPDQISGGFGADLIRADDGDLISGGAGADDFAVTVDATTDSAVIVADYDRTLETLTFEFDGTVPEFSTLTANDLSSVFLPDQNQVQIFVDLGGGPMLIALLNGQTAAIPDPASAGIFLQRI